MDAYRDQYAQLFRGGQGVTLLAISTDADTTLASWARDKEYPHTFLSDPDAQVGQRYGVARPGARAHSRVVFVVDADGVIRHVMAPFREVDASAYVELGEAVARIAR
jgi:peroxiredoxin Q/BCP